MATINLNDAMAWLKKMEEQSNINRQRFEARPSVPASQAWSGYRDRPGGQRLMVRQMQRPEIDNTLTVKNDGTQTLVKKWKDPDQSNVQATGLGGSGGSLPIYQQPWLARKAYFDSSGRNQAIRDMVSAQEEGLHRGLPERVSQVEQIRRMIHEQPRSGSSILSSPDISNIRAMHNAMQRPHPLVVGEEPKVSAWQSIMDRLNDSREQIRRRREEQTMAPFDLFQRFGWRNN